MMKKNLFKLLPILLLGLTACGGGGGGGNSSGGGTSGDTPTTKDVTVLAYIDYNHADEDHPYHSAEWYFSTPFTQEDIGLVDPKNDEANYPEFAKFIGWSLHPVIDDEKDLFEFGKEVKEKDGTPPFIVLYGIWGE